MARVYNAKTDGSATRDRSSTQSTTVQNAAAMGVAIAFKVTDYTSGSAEIFNTSNNHFAVKIQSGNFWVQFFTASNGTKTLVGPSASNGNYVIVADFDTVGNVSRLYVNSTTASDTDTAPSNIENNGANLTAGSSTTSLDVEIHQVLWLDRIFTSGEISNFVAESGGSYLNEMDSVIDIATERGGGRSVAFYDFVDGLDTATDKGGDSVDFDTLGWQGSPSWNSSNLYSSPTPVLVLEWLSGQGITSGETLNLGNVNLGESLKSRLRIKNTGDADLTNIGATVAGDITIDTSPPVGISSGDESFMIINLTTSGSDGDVQSGSFSLSSNEISNFVHDFSFTLRDAGAENRTLVPHSDWNGERWQGYSNNGDGGATCPTESPTARGSGSTAKAIGRPWVGAYGTWLRTENQSLKIPVAAGTIDPSGIDYVMGYAGGGTVAVRTQTKIPAGTDAYPISDTVSNNGINTVWGYVFDVDISSASVSAGDLDVFFDIVPVNGLNTVVKMTISFDTDPDGADALWPTRTTVTHVDENTLYEAIRDAGNSVGLELSDAGGEFDWPSSESGSNLFTKRPLYIKNSSGSSSVINGPEKSSSAIFRPKAARMIIDNVDIAGDNIYQWYPTFQSYSITAVSTANDSVTVGSDLTQILAPGDRIRISGSTGKTGLWTIESLSESGGSTTIVFVEDVQDSTVDGNVRVNGTITIVGGSTVDSNGPTGPTYGYPDGVITQQWFRNNEGAVVSVFGHDFRNYLGPCGAACVYGCNVVASFDSIIYVPGNLLGPYGQAFNRFRPTEDFKQRKSLEETLTVSSVQADTPSSGITRVNFSGSPTLYGSGFSGETLRVVTAASGSLDSDTTWAVETSGVSSGFYIDVEDPDDTAELLTASDVVWTYVVAHADSGQFITGTRYTISAVSTGSSTFTVAGTDLTDDIIIGRQIEVKDSTGNNGKYTVTNLAYTTDTVITVSETVSDATVDGYIKIVDDYHRGIVSGNYDSRYFSAVEPNPQPMFDNNAARDSSEEIAFVGILTDHEGDGSASSQSNTKKDHYILDGLTHVGCNFLWGTETEVDALILDSAFQQVSGTPGDDPIFHNNHFETGTPVGDWSSTGILTFGDNYEPPSELNNDLYFTGAGFRRPIGLFGNTVAYDGTGSIGAIQGSLQISAALSSARLIVGEQNVTLTYNSGLTSTGDLSGLAVVAKSGETIVTGTPVVSGNTITIPFTGYTPSSGDTGVTVDLDNSSNLILTSSNNVPILSLTGQNVSVASQFSAVRTFVLNSSQVSQVSVNISHLPSVFGNG